MCKCIYEYWRVCAIDYCVDYFICHNFKLNRRIITWQGYPPLAGLINYIIIRAMVQQGNTIIIQGNLAEKVVSLSFRITMTMKTLMTAMMTKMAKMNRI